MNQVQISSSTLEHALSRAGIHEQVEHYTPIEAAELEDRRIVVGMLCHDEDCQDPLTSCEGMGRVYTAHRSAGADEHNHMQEALGLDSNWDPSENAVMAGLAKMRRISKLLADMLEKKPFEVQYRELRRLRLIGDPFVQVLDVYEHSGTVYSIQGEGMQCQFDTSRGGAVWVPDDSAREECERRAKILAFGRLVRLRTEWTALLTLSGQQESLGQFNDWASAFTTLEKAVTERDLQATTLERQAIGMARAAEDVARGCIEEYNAWLSGDCHGYRVFQAVRGADSEELEIVGDELESCWGFIGSEYAQEELKSAVIGAAERLKAKVEA